MLNIRKIASFLIILSLFALTACGGSNEEVAKVEEESAKVEEAVGEILRVGMDPSYPPFETTDADGNPTGISVEIADAFGEFLGREVEIVPVPFGSLIVALDTGDIDVVIGSMSITDDRAKKVDFSKIYNYFSIIGLANKDYYEKHNLNEETTWEDIFAIKDTKFVGLASQISTTIPEQRGFEVLQSNEKSTAILEVSQGSADFLIMSAELIAHAHKNTPNKTVMFAEVIEKSPVGMAFKKGNNELVEKANEFIDQMESSGLNDKIRAKYDDIINEGLGIEVGYNFYVE